MLFTGTLRFNLTPFGEHSDAECWAALRRAHLSEMVEATPLGLDLVLSEGGAPLSAGQKQLVALARALLRHSKVRLMQSAPASAADMLLHRKMCMSMHAHLCMHFSPSGRVLVVDAGKPLLLAHSAFAK